MLMPASSHWGVGAVFFCLFLSFFVVIDVPRYEWLLGVLWCCKSEWTQLGLSVNLFKRLTFRRERKTVEESEIGESTSNIDSQPREPQPNRNYRWSPVLNGTHPNNKASITSLWYTLWKHLFVYEWTVRGKIVKQNLKVSALPRFKLRGAAERASFRDRQSISQTINGEGNLEKIWRAWKR